MLEPTNACRAQDIADILPRILYDKKAARRYRTETMHPDDIEAAITDLLCNVRHFCDRYHVDFASTYERAMGLYEYELSEEGPPSAFPPQRSRDD